MKSVGKAYLRLSLLSLSFPFSSCGLVCQAKRTVCLSEAFTWPYSVDVGCLTEISSHLDYIGMCKPASTLHRLLFALAYTKVRHTCVKLPLISSAPDFAQQKKTNFASVQLGTCSYSDRLCLKLFNHCTVQRSAPPYSKLNMAEELDDSGVLMNEESSASENPTQMDVDLPIQEPDSQTLGLDSLFESSCVEQDDSGLLEMGSPQAAASGPADEKQTILPKPLLAEVTRLIKHGKVNTEGGGTTDGTAEVFKIPSKKMAKKSKKRKSKKNDKEGDGGSLSSSSSSLPAVVQATDGDDQTPVEHMAKLHTGGKKRNKRKKTKSDRDESKADAETGNEPSKPRHAAPTHFISIQINNPQIHAGMAEVQQAILAAEKKMEVAMVSTATAHLTLMVMRLETDEDVKRVSDSLDKCVSDHWSNYSQGSDQLELEVSGLGHFDHTVLFAKISPGPQLEELQKIAKSVESCLADDDVQKADPKPFKPHITLMKFSGKRGQVLRKQGIKKIDPSLYESFTDRVFGIDTVRSIQLCSMTLPKHKETGYYHIEHEISFGLFKNDGGKASLGTRENVTEPSEETAGSLGGQSVLSGENEKTPSKSDDQSVFTGETEKTATKFDNQSVFTGETEKTATKSDDQHVSREEAEKTATKSDDQSVSSEETEKTATKSDDQSVFTGETEKIATKSDDQSVLSEETEKTVTKSDDQSVLSGEIEKSVSAFDQSALSENVGKNH